MDTRPIGVFDSGVGGLTVVKEIHRLLPAEHIVYCGDTARVPYGGKSLPVIQQFSLEIMRFLEQVGVKLIVVACNTASSVALDHLKQHTELPVIGVIEPGVRAAIRHTTTGRIGVIGTRATIRSSAYQQRLRRLRHDCVVQARACPLLVPIVEENLLETPIARLALQHYLTEFGGGAIDTLILACTHYPLLKTLIAETLPGVDLVDSAAETAIEVQELLAARRLASTQRHPGELKFNVSDSPETFVEIGRRFLETDMANVTMVSDWTVTPTPG